MLYPYVEPRRLIMKFTKEKEEQLVRLMQDYNASDLGELMDILPDLDLEDYEDEDELPQLPQQEVTYKEPAVLIGDASCPFTSFPFN